MLYHILKKVKDNCEIITHVVFDKERYQAINLKYKGNVDQCSILIFGTGNILITGAKSMQDLDNSYKFITEVINNNFETVKDRYVI